MNTHVLQGGAAQNTPPGRSRPGAISRGERSGAGSGAIAARGDMNDWRGDAGAVGRQEAAQELVGDEAQLQVHRAARPPAQPRERRAPEHAALGP